MLISGGSKGGCPPSPSVHFFSISCSLLEILTKSYVGAPHPEGWHPLVQRILDLPLLIQLCRRVLNRRLFQSNFVSYTTSLFGLESFLDPIEHNFIRIWKFEFGKAWPHWDSLPLNRALNGSLRRGRVHRPDQISGGSRISARWEVPTLKVYVKSYYLSNFSPKTAWNWNDLDQRGGGGGVAGTPLGAPMQITVQLSSTHASVT